MKSLLLLNRVFGVETDQAGQYLDTRLNLRHAPLIINESGCNANTKTMNYTTRETKAGVRQKKEFDSEKRRWNTIQICMRLSYLAQDRLDFAEPRSIWPRECVNVVNSSSLHRNVHRDISMGSTKLCCDFEDKNTLTKSHSSWTASSLAIEFEKQYCGIGGSDW